MQRNFRKTMSFMLALVMVFSLIPFQAFAADSTSPVNTGLLAELQTVIDEILARYSITKQMSTAEVYNAVYAMDDYWTPMGEVYDFEESEAIQGLTEAEAQQIVEANATFSDFASALYERRANDKSLALFATASTLDGAVSFSDTSGTISESSGTVTATAKGGLLSKATNTITITNNSGSTATLSFDYTVTSANSFTIDGASAATSGTFSRLMNAGDSVVFSITSNSGWSNLTVTLTMKNFSLTQAAASSNITIEFDSTYGSVTAAGSAVSSGDTVEASLSEGLALVATAKSSTFIGWVDAATGNILSTSASYTLSAGSDMTVKAAFAVGGADAWFQVGTKLFDDLNAADDYAVSSGTGTIILAGDGTLPAGTYDITSGKTLLVPRDASDTGSYAKTETTGTAASPFRTLTIAEGASITLNGTIINNATISSAQGGKAHSGEVAGAYGRIINNGTVTMESGSKWIARGYVDGDGLITVKSGATMYQPLVVHDWRGGGATLAVNSNVFPLNVYSMVNVMCRTQYQHGASLHVIVQLKVTLNALDQVDAEVMGTSDGCIFKMESGSVLETKFNKTDRKMEYTVAQGTVKVTYLNVSVSMYSMSSENTVVPLNDMFTINVKSGATVEVTHQAKFLPGTTMNIEDGGTVNISGSLYLYRGNDYKATYANSQYTALPNSGGLFSNAARYSSFAGVNAQINIYGTGKLTGNVYVSSATGDNSAVIHCINGGTFENTATSATTVNEHVSTSETIEAVAFAVAAPHAVHTTTGVTAPNYANGGYKYVDSVVAPTCNQGGYTKHTCSVCDYYYTDTETGATGVHTYGEVTYSGDGKTTYTASRSCQCGDTQTDEAGISSEQTKAPSCTEEGELTYTANFAEEWAEDKVTTEVIGMVDHSWNEGVVTDPTCIAAGYTTYTCTVDNCGATKTEDGAPATGIHKDENGDNKCDDCGEELLFDISFASMTMGNSLAINFAFEKGHVADWTGHYAEIVKVYADGRDDVVQTVQLSNWKSTNINGVAHYYVTFNGIAAKEMTDNVYVTIYNAEGEAVSNTWTDSVRGQAMRNLAKATIGAEEKTMVVDMLNYGAAAQQEFQYNTADLATALLSDDQKALATESTTYEDTHVGEGNYVASNLMLKSNIQLMFAFRNVTSDMKAVVTFTNHRGVAKNITIEGTEFTKNGSLSVVTVEDMVVADSRQDITCTIYDGETVVAAITDSVESYAARKSNNLFEMLMRFSDSAYAYFH